MSIILFPRMSPMAVDIVLSERDHKTNEDAIVKRVGNLPNAVSYAPVGGTRATDEYLGEIRNGLIDIARRHGFPNEASVKKRAAFDNDATIWVMESEYFQTGEALRDDVWAFVSTWLVGDLTKWRFGGARTRYQGGVRNTFQRFLLRGRALDRGIEHTDRWGLIRSMTEDALVAISERPSIGGRPLFARAIGEGWMRALDEYGAGAMEDLMRKTIIGLRLQNEVRDLCALSTPDLAKVVDAEFSRSADLLDLKKKRGWF